MPSADIVIVSYNSRAQLRSCVEPLALAPDLRVVVVDNASHDGSLEVLEGLPVEAIQLDRNGGFAVGCNVGWRAGESPYVLFLNPDTKMERAAVNTLIEILELDSKIGAVAPNVVQCDGALEFSQRRYPRARSTFARALFLHRLLPTASWSDELVRDERCYSEPASPDWVSGACLMLRRPVLEEVGGFDEAFFMYCEDIDLCRRVRTAGYDVRYEPRARVVHEGGASAPRSELRPTLVESRLRYARKHLPRSTALAHRLGLGLEAFSHSLVCRGGLRARLGHAHALGVVLRGAADRPYQPSGQLRGHSRAAEG